MKTLLEFKSLTKHFGRIAALNRVDFSVEPGQIMALLGPNGAGKSTLFGCLLGLLHHSEYFVDIDNWYQIRPCQASFLLLVR